MLLSYMMLLFFTKFYIVNQSVTVNCNSSCICFDTVNYNSSCILYSFQYFILWMKTVFITILCIMNRSEFVSILHVVTVNQIVLVSILYTGNENCIYFNTLYRESSWMDWRCCECDTEVPRMHYIVCMYVCSCCLCCSLTSVVAAWLALLQPDWRCCSLTGVVADVTTWSYLWFHVCMHVCMLMRSLLQPDWRCCRCDI